MLEKLAFWRKKIKKVEPIKKPKIVKDLNILKQPCKVVTKEDDIKPIIKKLKEVMDSYKCFGVTANQIGINKRISYIRTLTQKKKGKKVKKELKDIILINPKIMHKEGHLRIKKEGCLSLPLTIDTLRYNHVVVRYLNLKFEEKIIAFKGLSAIIAQHEIDHTNGRTIINASWRRYKQNRR